MRQAVLRQAHEAVQSPGLRGIRHKSLELGHGEYLAGYYTRNLLYLQVAVKGVEACVLLSEAACVA
jgi:hypothetical protein